MKKPVCLFVCLFLLAFGGAAAAQEKKDSPEKKTPTKIDPAKIAELIRQLGSGDFNMREKATRELSNLDEVPAALREAAKGKDPEVVTRAAKVIGIISARIEEREFQAMMRDVDKLELDRFVHRMVTDKEFGAGDKQWDILQAIVKAVTKKANDQGGKDFGTPALAMKTMPLVLGVPVRAEGKRVILSETSEQPFHELRDCVVLCSGRMKQCTSLRNCIVIVDGDFEGAVVIENSLLIVRGKIGGFNGIRNSIILATGEFERATMLNNSFLQVKNAKIRFTGSSGSVVLNSTLNTTGPTDSKVLKVDKGPLQLLKFNKTEKELDLKDFQSKIGEIELDLLVRRMVTDKKFAEDDKNWDILEAVAKLVTKKANEQAGRNFDVPAFAMKTMWPNRRSLMNRPGRITSLDNGVILCSGEMDRVTGIGGCIVIVDGDFKGATSIRNSLVIVRGNIGRCTSIDNSIILATGNFTGATSIENSLLQTNTQVSVTKGRDRVVLKADQGPLPLLKFSKPEKK